MQSLKIYQSLIDIRLKNSYYQWSQRHRVFAHKIWASHHAEFSKISLFKIVSMFLEICTFFFLKTAIKSDSLSMSEKYIFPKLLLLLVLLVLLLVANYFLYTEENSLKEKIANFTRLSWMKDGFRKPWSSNYWSVSQHDHSKQAAKIFYHLPLFKIGLQQCLFQIIKLAPSLIVIAALILALSPSLLWFELIIIFIGLAISALAYLISFKLISRQQTLNAKIVELLFDFWNNIRPAYHFGWFDYFTNKLNDLQEIDLQLRVKRETWTALTRQGIYLLSVCVNLLVFWILDNRQGILHQQNIVESIFIIGLLIRILPKFFIIGIYFLPLKIGFYLSAPELRKKIPTIKFSNIINSSDFKVVFQSKKVRLDKRYLKNVKLQFQAGDRVALEIESQRDRFLLEKILSGQATSKQSLRAWIVKLNKRRYFYDYWALGFENKFAANLRIEGKGISIGEYISGTPRGEIKSGKFQLMLDFIRQTKELHFIMEKNSTLGFLLDDLNLDYNEIAKLQLAHCIFNKKRFIVFSPIWNYFSKSSDFPQVKSLLKTMQEELTSSIVVNFGTNFKYNKHYQLYENSSFILQKK